LPFLCYYLQNCQEVSHFYHFTSTFLQKTKHLTLTPLEIGLIFKNRVFKCFLTIYVLYVGRYLKFPCASLPNSQAPMPCTWQNAELHIRGKYRPLPLGKSSQDLEKIFSIRPALKFRIQVHNSADWSFVGHKVGLTWSAEDRSGINFPSDGGDGSDSRPQEIAPCPGNMEFCETALDYPSRHVPQVIHSNFTHSVVDQNQDN